MAQSSKDLRKKIEELEKRIKQLEYDLKRSQYWAMYWWEKARESTKNKVFLE